MKNDWIYSATELWEVYHMKVLLIVGDTLLRERLLGGLQERIPGVEVIEVTTLEKGKLSFIENGDIRVVVVELSAMNGAVSFVRELREQYRFPGVIVGMALWDEDREALQEAGCDCVCKRSNLLKVLPGLLKRTESERQNVAPTA